MYKKFNILRGEITSGNDNPDIKKELKSITLILLDMGKLSKSSAYNLLYSLSL